MKKIVKKLVIFCIIIVGILIWYDQSRSFYKATNGQSITVWKRLGGTCYLIPDEYYGVTKPNNGYIETSNLNHLTLYFSKRLPNYILIKKETNINYKVVNSKNKKLVFEDYMLNEKKYDPIIYKKGNVRFIDINTDASLLSINIGEGYATDETGETQR